MNQNQKSIELILNEKTKVAFQVQLLPDLLSRYQETLKENRFPGERKLDEMDPDEITLFLKREKFNIGKYKKITVFEAANRIASDLVLLEGLQLIAQKSKATKFKILLGNHHVESRGDFSLQIDGKWHEGEAFSVAKSYYHPKLSNTVSKWTDSSGNCSLRYILFNSKAHKTPDRPTREGWELYLQGGKVTVWENTNAVGITD